MESALSQPPEQVLAHLFERWQQKGIPDELRRVDLIKGKPGKGARQLRGRPRRLTQLAADGRGDTGVLVQVDLHRSRLGLAQV